MKQERLDKIEIQLTPKEWGVRLAERMRRHASKEDFLRVLATETDPESPHVKPIYALAEQAHERHPGSKPEDIRARNQLNRKLRTEYLGMKALILKVNEAAKEKTESLRMKVILKLCTLYTLIVHDAFGQTARERPAWAIDEMTDDFDLEEEREFMLNELVVDEDEIYGETPDNSLPPDQGPDPGFTSLIEVWVADSTTLIKAAFAHKAAAQIVQEKYFDGHPILCQGIEVRLDETIRTLEDAAVAFNQYLKIRDAHFQPELNQEGQDGRAATVTGGKQQDQPVIDIQTIRARVGRHLVDPLVNEWVQYAKQRAFTKIQEESGEHEAPVRETVRDQSQVCEIPITVQGTRNSDAAEPFLEETHTVAVLLESSTPPVAPSPMPQAPRLTPEDSLAINKAIIAAYEMPADAPTEAVAPDPGRGPTDSIASIHIPTSVAPAAPASPIPPAVVIAPAANDERASGSERTIADTLVDKNTRSEVLSAELSSEPAAMKSAPIANQGPIADTIELIETGKENVSRPAPALRTMDSERSSAGPVTSTSRTPAKRTKTFAAVGVVGLVIASGAAAYLWHGRGKAAASQPVGQIVSTAAPSASSTVLPQEPPAQTNAQTAPSATPELNAPAGPNQAAPPGSGTRNAARSKPTQSSANVAARKPSTLPFQIAPPVTPSADATNTKSGNTITAPDLGAQVPPTRAGGQNGILGSIVSDNSPPAPPPAPRPAAPAGNFVEPRLLSTVPPAYPKIAFDRGDEGEVTITAVVNEAGKVKGTKVISGPLTLRQAAAAAVSLWRFEPAKVNGKPVTALVTVKVAFHMPN